MESTVEVSTFKPIGIFHCDGKKKYDVPRQAVLNPKVGIIRLNSGLNFETALEDLTRFSHIWIIYLFDNQTWKPKVQTPRELKKKGVFASRSPYRPNPIGLSLVELVSINKLEIQIKNYDLLNQSQILDIKPYIAYSDSVADNSEGWLEQIKHFSINYHDEFYIKLLKYFPETPSQLISFINQQLSAAPVGHPNKRVKLGEGDGNYILAYQYYRILFNINGSNITVRDLLRVSKL
jgi:tRNA-Thr(GGU) m(6)t(6)A37 methyltransferase TsaA